MTESLASALAELSLNSQNLSGPAFDARLAEEEDGVYSFKPRQRARQDAADLKQELEQEFLSPSSNFSPEWLNRLQRFDIPLIPRAFLDIFGIFLARKWDVPTDYTDLFEVAGTQTRTIVRFDRDGLEGRVTGYHEVTVPASSANAKNSTSLLRRPAGRADFVRGAAGFFPFAPGGLEGVEAIAEMESEAQTPEHSRASGKQSGLDRIINFGAEGGLLEIAPGFSRGLKFEEAKTKEAAEGDEEVEHALQQEETDLHVEQEETASDAGGVKIDDEAELSDEEDIDSLLPVEFPALEPHAPLLAGMQQRKAGK
ncbi:hypothetical protein AbraIFM66950_011376, partial [Aspergillus brasiliensis]